MAVVLELLSRAVFLAQWAGRGELGVLRHESLVKIVVGSIVAEVVE